MDRAEFDKFADDYRAIQLRNIRASGEAPEFFHAYKVADVFSVVSKSGLTPQSILDFGAGVGNSIPHFQQAFPTTRLICADVSQKSLDVAATRFPSTADFRLINDVSLPVEDSTVDVAFSACVFHHIDHAEHTHWLQELFRATRRGGRLFIFEHNPINPLTVHAVNTCEFDENARLMSAGILRRRIESAGWKNAEVRYRVFFPRMLAALRPLEKFLVHLPLGAQYFVTAER